MISLLWSPGHPSFSRWALVLCLGLLSGCGRDEVKVYRVAKEQHHAHEAKPGLPEGHPDTGAPAGKAVPRLKYTLPAGWQEAPPGEMRVASFRVVTDGKQADIGVVPLPGFMGADLESVNRWRSTVGLEAVKEEDLAKLAEPIEIAGQPAQLFDQGGENPGSGEKARILVAVLRREGVAWFFKMSGDDELVKQQKPVFVNFLKELAFDAGLAPVGPVASAPAPGTALPDSHPPIGDAGVMQTSTRTGSADAPQKPAWQAPSSWKEASPGGFLVAKYIVTGSDNARADINVSQSAGTGGGVVGNVNRWRGQLGLGELPEEEVNKLLVPVDTASGKAVSVDMTGMDARTGQKARLVAVIVPQPSRTWFYKLMGSEHLVASEKDQFLKFVQSAKAP